MENVRVYTFQRHYEKYHTSQGINNNVGKSEINNLTTLPLSSLSPTKTHTSFPPYLHTEGFRLHWVARLLNQIREKLRDQIKSFISPTGERFVLLQQQRGQNKKETKLYNTKLYAQENIPTTV